MGRPTLETILADLGPIVGACSRAITSLDEWTADEEPTKVDPFHEYWTLKVTKAPRGVVLIIAPWCVFLLFSPCISPLSHIW